MSKVNDNALMVTKEDLLLTNSPFAEAQMQLFYQRTPQDKVMSRPAKGGGQWTYVKTGYVIETLNRIFGYLWNFEVLTSLEEAAKIAGSGTCVVKGRLTVYVGDKVLVKEQFGRCDVKYRKGTKEFLDFGNDMKGAASDALKKCASEFGLFSDIYHQDDFEELKVVTTEEKEQIEMAKIQAANKQMGAARTMEELRIAFCKLPISIRSRKEVIACKDALKRKIESKGKEASNG